MTRAAIPGLPSPHPIGELLPALFAEDDFAQRFTAGLDTVLAPVFTTLDSLPAYFRPRLAPPDFLDWLASWVAVDVDPAWPEEVRRAVVERAVELHRWRGTRRGLAERLRLVLGAGAEIVDGGGASWSTAAGAGLPPAPNGELLVRVWPLRGPGPDEGPARGPDDGPEQELDEGPGQGPDEAPGQGLDRAPGQGLDEEQVLAVVRAGCPVHLTCRVEILPGPPGRAED